MLVSENACSSCGEVFQYGYITNTRKKCDSCKLKKKPLPPFDIPSRSKRFLLARLETVRMQEFLDSNYKDFDIFLTKEYHNCNHYNYWSAWNK